MGIDRRGLVVAGICGAAALAGGTVTLTGCTSKAGSPSPSPTGSGSPSGGESAPASTGVTETSRPTVSPSSSGPSGTALPSVTRWSPSPNDIQPAVKLRAVRLIEALGNWTPADPDPRSRASKAGYRANLVSQADGLLPAAGSAALQVLEAQYGGILADSASVLVVCRQWTPAGPTGGITVDVRLTSSQPVWTVTALHPPSRGPPRTHCPPPPGPSWPVTPSPSRPPGTRTSPVTRSTTPPWRRCSPSPAATGSN
ncbi:hypothetical protein ACFQZC_30650 [Streptacidiphilus monticola]